MSSHVEAREANVPGPHEQRRYKTVSIRGGNNIWREFKLATHLDNCDVVSLLDKHDAVDNMTRHEAVDVGVDLDHMEYVCTLLCSYGLDQRLQAFDRSQEWYPMVTECDGYTFTDYRVGTHPSVDIYIVKNGCRSTASGCVVTKASWLNSRENLASCWTTKKRI